MGSELRSEKLPLKEELQRNAHQFSFEMAAYILEYQSDIPFGKEINILQAPFKTYSINSFCIRGTEIEKIKKIDDKNVIYLQRLAISGLNAPVIS